MHGHHAHGAGDFLTSHGLVLMVAILVMNSVLMLLIFLPSVAATIGADQPTSPRQGHGELKRRRFAAYSRVVD